LLRTSRDVLIGSSVNFTEPSPAARSARRQGLGAAGPPVLNDAARVALLIEKNYGQSIARRFDDA
jgi:hypothetical protein